MRVESVFSLVDERHAQHVIQSLRYTSSFSINFHACLALYIARESLLCATIPLMASGLGVKVHSERLRVKHQHGHKVASNAIFQQVNITICL